MQSDPLLSRFFLGGLILFLLIVVSSFFYNRHIRREIKEREAETLKFVQQLKQNKTISEAPHAEGFGVEEQFQTEPPLESGDTSKVTTETTKLPQSTETMSITDLDLTPFDFEEAIDTDTPENSVETSETELTLLLVNTQFSQAIELFDEKLEIKKRLRRVQHPSGISYYERPPGDEERLQEIQYELYDILSPISEIVPGAVRVEIRQGPYGSVTCEHFHYPSVFQNELGQVPEGYHQFVNALQPFLDSPSRYRR